MRPVTLWRKRYCSITNLCATPLLTDNNMKIRSIPLSAAVVMVSALRLPTPVKAWVSSRHISFERNTPYQSFSSSTTLRSSTLTTTAPAEEEAVSSSSTDKPSPLERTTIAEGTIISRFPGGLAAVRLLDDVMVDDDASNSSTASSVFNHPSDDDTSSTVTEQAANTSSSASTSSGSTADMQGKDVVFPDGSTGVVVAHRPPVVFVYSDSSSAPAAADSDGLIVKIQSDMAMVSVDPTRPLVECFHHDENDDTTTTGKEENNIMKRPMFAPIPQVKDIALINNPMLTGITMFDTIAPTGQGQNMLFVGHHLNEMQSYALDYLQTQIRDHKSTNCVYATTSENHSNVLEQLQERGLEQDVHVLVPKDQSTTEKDEASRAAEAVAIAASACAVGEAYALEKGMNALVVIDTIDLHKKLWDVTTRVLVDVFGVDAVVQADREGGASSEMRAFYSSLIQRSAQYNQKRGGGSVTLLLLTTIPSAKADSDTVFQESDFEQSSDKVKERIKLLVRRNIPLTEANLRRIDIPVPSASEGARRLALQHIDDLISMSDGQIWLSERLEAAGQYPPMDPQRSVTRVGIGAGTESRADAPALRRVAERLRLDLAQAAHMDGAEDTKASKRQIQRKNALLLAMHQKPGAGGRRLSESCVALLAASQGYLDEVVENGALAGTDEGEKVMADMMEHVLETAGAAMHEVDECLDMSPEVRGQLADAIESFFQ